MSVAGRLTRSCESTAADHVAFGLVLGDEPYDARPEGRGELGVIAQHPELALLAGQADRCNRALEQALVGG